MLSRRLWLVVVVMLIPTAGRAHDHNADYFLAGSYAKGSNIWGLHQAFAKTIKPGDYDWSVVGDLGFHFGSHDGSGVTRIAFVGGVRYTFPGNPKVHKNRLSLHALGGGVRTHEGAESDTDPALVLGAGYEFLPRGHMSAAGWAFRIQGDYVVNDRESFPRVSLGFVHRFQRLPKP